tara:strand:- start:127 stop:453 length:327 start_codon:yes stop_codon:yes gene_type:complete
VTISEMRNALAQQHAEKLKSNGQAPNCIGVNNLQQFALKNVIAEMNDDEVLSLYKELVFEPDPEVEVEVLDKENNTWHPTHILDKQAAENAIAYAVEMSKRKPFTWKK